MKRKSERKTQHNIFHSCENLHKILIEWICMYNFAMVFSWHHLYCSWARFSSFIVLPVDRKLKCFKMPSGIACFPFSFIFFSSSSFLISSLSLSHFPIACTFEWCTVLYGMVLCDMVWYGSVAHMCTTIIGNEINKLIDTCSSLKVLAIVRWYYIVKSS